MATIAAFAACSGVSRDAGYQTVQQSVDRAIAPKISSADTATAAKTAILRDPLTADAAVRLAMANNPELLASFEEVGLARGDLVAAGVLPNPNFKGSVRWRDSSPGSNPELELTWDVMELLRRSKRRNVVHAEMNRVAYQVSDRALAFAADVRTSFYDYQAAEHVRRMRVEVLRAAQASADLSSRQRSSGNISELEKALEQSVYQDARLDLLRSEADAIAARTSLAGRLGLAAADTTWSVETELPELPAADPSADTLQATALQGRFDLMAAKTELDASRRDVSYQKSFRIPSLEIGVDAEREFEEEWAYGPVVHMAIPLFDRGQGGVDRAQARVRQAEHGVASLETRVRNDVRGSWERLSAARAIAEMYRDDVIPTKEKVVEESQRHYNYMLVGPMALLQAKRDEIEAYQKYIEAVRDYWTARAELERAVARPIEELE